MDVINSRTVIISPGSLCTGGGGGWHWPVTCGMSWVILTFFFFTFVLFFLLFHIFNSFFTFFYMRHINIYRYFLTLVFAFIGLLIWMILLYIFFATISIFLFDLFFSSRHLCFFFFLLLSLCLILSFIFHVSSPLWFIRFYSLSPPCHVHFLPPTDVSFYRFIYVLPSSPDVHGGNHSAIS